ncbi:protein serine/threonine phosphatase [Candidatus Moduliflexus flocculans]|uniref:Protein serine/threonine phosphatase n=1 Tax=Candidatus Moduliflexus flocculans TaxID=1499966 RepID=A0A0S6W6K1_9BACT|nr:protein serine/threonine phosphatase [Candidatus Moduliflexus flocculans]
MTGVADAKKPTYFFRSSAETDIGLRKTSNEDSFWNHAETYADAAILKRLGTVYAVADGVSGHVGGDVASNIAIDTLRMYYVLPHVNISPEDRLRNVFLEAHRRIEDYAREHPEYRGMGTTLTTVVLRDSHLHYAHVGDSRLYLIQSASREIRQLTKDHSLVNRYIEEGKLTPEEAAEEDSNVLDQALGCVPKIRIEMGERDALMPGDFLLLCSDGLSDLVSDTKIRDVVLGSPSLEDACHRLILKANQQGGRDNITVVLVAIEKGTQEGMI